MRGVLFLAAIAAVAACASAGSPTDKPVDAKGPADTSMVTDKQDAPGHPVDAPGTTGPHDAPVTQVDARPDAPPPPPDASTDGNTCNANSQCTDSGECCVTLGNPFGFCAPGTVIGSNCFPN